MACGCEPSRWLSWAPSRPGRSPGPKGARLHRPLKPTAAGLGMLGNWGSSLSRCLWPLKCGFSTIPWHQRWGLPAPGHSQGLMSVPKWLGPGREAPQPRPWSGVPVHRGRPGPGSQGKWAGCPGADSCGRDRGPCWAARAFPQEGPSLSRAWAASGLQAPLPSPHPRTFPASADD